MGSRVLSCPPTPLWCLDPSLTLGLLSVSFLSPGGRGHLRGHSLGKQPGPGGSFLLRPPRQQAGCPRGDRSTCTRGNWGCNYLPRTYRYVAVSCNPDTLQMKKTHPRPRMRSASLHVTAGARYVEAARLSWRGETSGAGAAVAVGREGSRVRVRAQRARRWLRPDLGW